MEAEQKTIREMLDSLVSIPLEAWGYYAFSRDPVNARITAGQRREWTRKAIACGMEHAQKVIHECGSNQLDLICRHFGLTVSFPEILQQDESLLFAEYWEPDKISVYGNVVRKGQALCETEDVPGIIALKADIRNILLAHEVFHFLEYRYKQDIYTKTQKIRMWAIGPVHNDSGIMALGEIAAMAFSQKINHLPYAPYVIDLLLAYTYSPAFARELYEEIMALKLEWVNGAEADMEEEI